jgi:preprotein translocase subunit SecE
MAVVVKDNQMSKQKPDDEPSAEDQGPETATDLARSGSGGGGGRAVATSAGGAGGGFFHIYKSGQGYWTRMGTVGGAALIILLVGNFLYTYLPTWFDVLGTHTSWLLGVVAASVVAMSLLVFWLMNKPTNADFLIATDSEMKKVNWTSRQELIGSTKVVIFFVVFITLLLFAIDILFGYVFFWVGVLKQPPF